MLIWLCLSACSSHLLILVYILDECSLTTSFWRNIFKIILLKTFQISLIRYFKLGKRDCKVGSLLTYSAHQWSCDSYPCLMLEILASLSLSHLHCFLTSVCHLSTRHWTWQDNRFLFHGEGGPYHCAFLEISFTIN